MKKVYRNMMLFSATVVFLAMAPLVVLYAMGYRLGSTTADPLPVGVLLVETVPRRAQLAVNGTVFGDTPHTLAGLPPGDIRVALSKEGYQPWEKNVSIEPGFVSEFRDIRLFPKELTKTTIASNARSFSLSPHRALLAVLTIDRKLVVIDEEGKLINSPLPLAAFPSSILWSPDSSSLLVLYKQGPGQVVVVANDDTKPPFLKILSSIKESLWDPRIPGRLLLLTATGDLKAYSHVNDSAHVIVRNIVTFATSSRMIYAVQQDGVLRTFTLSGEPLNTMTLNFPTKIERLFITPAGKRVVQTADKTLYLLPENGDPQQIAEHVISAGWSPDGQLLYVQPAQNELYVYNASADRLLGLPVEELQVVLRLSRPVTDPQWFAGNRHLIYQLGDEIMISEIDTRDHALQYRIDSTNMGHAHVAVGKDGQQLFYLTKTNQATQLTVSQLE